MRNTIWNKRIPTLVVLTLFVIGAFLLSWFVDKGIIFQSKASLAYQPEKVRISNVTDSSFTISYITEDKVLGTISYGKDQTLSQIAFDDRDKQDTSPKPYNVHSITIRNLEPSTHYFFSINSGNSNFLRENLPFDISTGPRLQETSSSSKVLTGTISFPQETTETEAVIYITASSTQTLSTLVKQNGSYEIPVSNMRNDNLSSYVDVSPNTSLHMLIVNNSLQSNVTLFANTTIAVPTILFSKNYDFTINTSPLLTVIPTNPVTFPAYSTTQVGNKNPQLILPTQSQGLTDKQPLFKGNGQPNQKVEITIHSTQVIQSQATIDSNGNWTYRPAAPLSPGQHTITITTPNSSGIMQTVSQQFVVNSDGSQFIDPSISPVQPTATHPPSPTTQSSQNFSPTPTKSFTQQTLTPTSFIIASPTPTVIILQSTIPPKKLPATGNSTALIGGIFAVTVSSIGSLLFFLSRSNVSV